MTLAELQKVLGGEVFLGALRCPAPDCDAKDRSMCVKASSSEGFTVSSLYSDHAQCVEYIRERISAANGGEHPEAEDKINFKAERGPIPVSEVDWTGIVPDDDEIEPRKAPPASKASPEPYILFKDLAENVAKEWLVAGMLGAGDASVFYGAPGAGKSVLVEDLALHVAEGRPWHGRKVKRGAVLFVALERRKLVERRAIAFRKWHGLTDLPLAIMGGVHDFRQIPTSLTVIATAKALEADTGQKVALIVIDTINRALCGGDENSSKDMGAIVAATGRIQDGTSAHVLWTHHMPIEAERMRGHGSLLGAVDTTIHVAKQMDGTRTATVIMSNDSEEGTAIAFTLDSEPVSEEDAEGNVTTAPVVVQSEVKARGTEQKRSRMPKGAQTALRALTEAINECGENAPASNHIPQGIKVVTIDQWRDYAYRRGISTGEARRAKPMAFQRASEHLIGAQMVVAWGEHVWLARI